MRFKRNFANLPRQLGFLCALLVAITFSVSALAQISQPQHGVGVGKSCPTATKVGDLATCELGVVNSDDFGDDIIVKQFYDVVGGNLRVPSCVDPDAVPIDPSCNLPIVGISEDPGIVTVTCVEVPVDEVSAPLGLIFPCTIHGSGELLEGGSGYGILVESEYTVPVGSENPLVDQGNLIVQDACNIEPLGCSTQDQNLQFGAAVSLFVPSIDVTKTGPATAKVGDEITYTIGFTDTTTGVGFPGFENCTGNDPLLGGDLGDFFEGVTRDFTYTVKVDDPDPLPNTVTITCGVVGFDNIVANSDRHNVDLIEPSINVTKTGPVQAKVGDEITYTIGFTDTSVGGTLGTCTGNDPMLGGPLGVFVDGVTRDFPYTVQGTDTNPLLNTATITCDVEGFDNKAEGEDSHSVDLIAPSIEVTKTGPVAAKVGDEITYTIGFTDTSVGGILGACTGNDPLLGGDLGPFTSGVTRDFTYTVQVGDPDPLLNTATIVCDVEGFDNKAEGEDGHSVDLIAPSIEVTKTGPASAKVGDEITYTIGFTDTSNGGVLGACIGNDPLLGGNLGAFTAGVTRDFTYTVQVGDPDPLLNTATIICDVEGFDNKAEGEDSHSVDLIAPSIEVTKTGPAIAKVGDEITYTIGFTDTSNGGALGACIGNDPLLGGNLGAFTAGVPRNFTYTVKVGDPDPLLNTATIICDVVGFNNKASGSDGHSVDLIDPSIDVTKTGPVIAKVGDEITYTIGFTNTGSGLLGVCTGDDPLLGGPLGVFVDGVTRDFLYTVKVDDPNPLLNTATITCDVEGFDNKASDNDSHSVDLIDPSIDVTKTGPVIAKVGDEITYTIGFTNTGSGLLGVCTGDDPLLGGPLGVFVDGVTRDFTYTVQVGDPNPLLNTATITCDVEGFDNKASDNASHSVDLIDPSIDVTKTGPVIAKVGDEITYTIGFTNTGSGLLGICTGDDPLLGGPLGVFVDGVTRDFTYTVQVGDPNPLLNTATITCDVEGFDNKASDNASHSVDLIDPSIDVTKTGPVIAKVGDEITYTIGFTNTGSGLLGICTGDDPLLGGPLGVFVDGVTRDFTYTVQVGDPNPLLNTATITCDVEGFDNKASDNASHSVDLIDPSIDVTKTGPVIAKVGDEITYTIGFTNTGSGLLGICTGDDPLLGGPLGVFVDGVTRDFTYTVQVGDPNPLLNTATITCDVEGFDNKASDNASHSVDLIDPSIDVTKTGPVIAKVGDEITYTIGFTNTGSGLLGICTGEDPLLGGPLGVFVDGVTRDFTYTVQVGDPNPLLNTATITCDVEGFDNKASDNDSHSVDLIDPSIDVTKTGPVSAKVGDEITYTIGFTNTGSGLLGICTGEDPLLGGPLGVFVDGVTRDFTYTVQVGDPDPLLNTATITCDVEGFDNKASDNASHSVDLIAPSIDVTKTGPVAAKVGDEITYTIGFTDTGIGTLGACTGSDPLLGGNLGAFTAGVTRDFTYTVQVGDPDPLLNTATITCDVEGFDNAASGSASHSVDLIAPSIDVTKTGPIAAKVGDEITYTIGFTDTSVGGILGACTGNDPLLGGDLGAFTAGVTRDFTYTVQVGDPDPLLNTATITCDVEGFDNKAEGEDSHSVDLIAPSIDVTKTGPVAAKAGDEITYTIGFTDTSVGGILGACTGNDPLLGGDLGAFTAGVTRDFTYTVQVGDPDPLLNTATITCDVEGFDNKAEGEDSHSVDLIAPSIEVTKTGPVAAKVGDEITYTIGFTDTSVGGILGACTGNDPLLGGDLGAFTAGVTRDFTYTVQVGDPDPLLNTATITCDVEGFDNKASGSASHSVDLIAPSIEVTKTGPVAAKVGDEITYTIGFTDTSVGGILGACTGNDPLLGGDLGAFTAGVTRDFTYTVQVGDPDPLLNTATITCDVEGFDNAASGSASHSVDLIAPSIEVTKTGPVAAKVGDEITYTIGFTDTSVGGILGACTGNDPLLGGDLGAFTAGVTRDFTYTVQVGDPDPLLNTATITCDVEGFDNKASGSASHSVDLIAPSIEVTKTGPVAAKVGDEITYTIGFTDTSVGGILGACTGNDPLLGGDLGAFTAGVTRDFTYTVQVGDPDPLLNTATITCDVEGFDNKASGSASHSVDLIAPSIDVTKTGPVAAKVGDEITYTIGFTDTSVGGILGACTGNDPLLGGDLGAFTAGVTRDFTYTVQVGDPDPLLNTATITCDVEGFDNKAEGEDSHSVDLIAPSIEVTKTGPVAAKVGDEITYTIGFTDTSVGGILGACTGNDPLLGGDLGAFTAGVTRDFTYTVQVGDPDPLLNTATITCDVEGFDNKAEGEDSHSVDLINPSVDLTKECRPDPVTPGETIEWAITVNNDGDTDLNCLVNDPTAGVLDEPVTVVSGGSETLNASRTVEASDAPVISNTATVDCSIEGFDNEVNDEATADCEVVVVDEICRTPGFWGTHAGVEKRKSTNLTQLVINAAGGTLVICGEDVTNTLVPDNQSATEAMCVSPQGEQRLQLARQLTAAALNCVISGGGADCTGISVEADWADANAACIANAGDLSTWIEIIDAWNNDEVCHERELSDSDVFVGVSPLPGPAGSPKDCNKATGNDVTIFSPDP